MKKITLYLITLLYGGVAFSQSPQTDAFMTTKANEIISAGPGQNTAARIGTNFLYGIDSKVNINQYAFVTVTGTDNYIGTIIPAITTYTKLRVFVTFPSTNTGPATVNLNSLGAKAIVNENGSALTAGTLPVGIKLLAYNGTSMQIVGGGGTPPGVLLAANNLSDLISAPTALTNLGGTTIGKNLFTLVNPGAITFPRFNADNTVTARTAAQLLGDLGAITSISGTPNRITSIGSTTPVIDIASTYVGQTSITTLGTITTGGYQATPITSAYIGTLPYIPLGGSATLTSDLTVFSPNHTYSMTLGSFGNFLANFIVGSDVISLRESSGTYKFELGSGVILNVGSDATGDTYYRDSFGKLIRLSIGGTNKYKTVTGGLPVWSTYALNLGGDVTTSAAFNVPVDAAGVLTNNGSGTLTWGAGGSSPFSDAIAILKDNVDATKLLRVELGGFTTGVTRVLTPPNFDGIIATTNNPQTITGIQTFSSLPTIPITPVASTDAASKGYVDGLLTGPFSTTLAGYTTASGTGVILKKDNTWLAPGTGLQVLRMNVGATDIEWAAASGGVSTVSIVSANGLAGTVANPTTTPAITLSTTITGLLKGNGTAISAASAGTDYESAGLDWRLATGGTLSGANTITGTTTNTLTLSFASLGITFTRGAGLAMINPTTSAPGAQQGSPIFSQIAQGWRTNATAQSQEVAFHFRVLPIQGAANPTAQWIISSQINAGTVNDRFFFNDDGALSIINGAQGVYLSAVSNSIDFGSGASGVIKTNGSTRISISSIGNHLYSQSVQTSGSPTAFTWTSAAHTTLATTVEALAVNFNTSATVQYATGAQALLRNFLIQAPTITFVGSSVTTDMATATITGASISGTNAIGTVNTHGLLIKSASVVSGTGTVANSFGLTSNAQTGATTNYAAQFLGGSGIILETAINDTNGNALLKFSKVASAVNQITISNSISFSNPTISATGTDATVSIQFLGKGGGGFNFNRSTDPLSTVIFAQMNTLGLQHYSTDAVGADFYIDKRRGSGGSLLTDVNGDVLGTVSFGSYDGTTAFPTAQIKSVLNGTITTNTLPTDLVFYTTTTNSLVEAARITSAGNLQVGTGNNIVGVSTNNNATAGNIGQEINAIQSTYTNYTTTATYQNIASITLTAGDWDISAIVTYNSNSATITAAANAVYVISTTTASAAGAVEGQSIGYIPQAALLGTSKFTDVLAPYRVSLSGTTTYYLNTQAAFSVGNPQFVGSIRARRMR